MQIIINPKPQEGSGAVTEAAAQEGSGAPTEAAAEGSGKYLLCL